MWKQQRCYGCGKDLVLRTRSTRLRYHSEWVTRLWQQMHRSDREQHYRMSHRQKLEYWTCYAVFVRLSFFVFYATQRLMYACDPPKRMLLHFRQFSWCDIARSHSNTWTHGRRQFSTEHFSTRLEKLCIFTGYWIDASDKFSWRARSNTSFPDF